MFKPPTRLCRWPLPWAAPIYHLASHSIDVKRRSLFFVFLIFAFLDDIFKCHLHLRQQLPDSLVTDLHQLFSQ